MRNSFMCAAAVMAAMAMPAEASSIDVDTTYTKAETSSWLYSPFGNSWIGQSFTPTTSGTLDRLDLQIAVNGSADLRVSFGSGESIDGSFTELYTADFAGSLLPLNGATLFSIDLSAEGLMLDAGSRYSVVLRAAPGAQGGFGWVIGETTDQGVEITLPPYAGGRAFASGDQGVTWGSRGADRSLRTWMSTSAVPEPATWAFMITGFGLVGIATRRRPVAA
jgi:hypothetical protein